jgi:hypothetical protein
MPNDLKPKYRDQFLEYKSIHERITGVQMDPADGSRTILKNITECLQFPDFMDVITSVLVDTSQDADFDTQIYGSTGFTPFILSCLFDESLIRLWVLVGTVVNSGNGAVAMQREHAEYFVSTLRKRMVEVGGQRAHDAESEIWSVGQRNQDICADPSTGYFLSAGCVDQFISGGVTYKEALDILKLLNVCQLLLKE